MHKQFERDTKCSHSGSHEAIKLQKYRSLIASQSQDNLAIAAADHLHACACVDFMGFCTCPGGVKDFWCS